MKSLPSRLVRHFVLLVVAMLVVAVVPVVQSNPGSSKSTGSAGGVRVVQEADVQSEQETLDAALALWTEGSPSSYTFIFQRSCECLPEATLPKVVHVEDGAIVAIDGVPLSSPDDNEFAIPTILEVFGIIQDAISTSNAFSVEVTYDPTYGNPVNVYIDYDEFIADEELIVSIIYPVDESLVLTVNPLYSAPTTTPVMATTTPAPAIMTPTTTTSVPVVMGTPTPAAPPMTSTTNNLGALESAAMGKLALLSSSSQWWWARSLVVVVATMMATIVHC